MNVCFLLSDITHSGGIERVTSNLAQEFLRKEPRINVDIVSQFCSGNKLWYNFENCKLHYLTQKDFDDKPHSFKRLLKIFANTARVRNFFNNHKYDYIISQSFPNTFLLYMAGISMKNVIAVEHVYYGYYNRLVCMVRKIIYRSCLKVIALTHLDKKNYDKELGINKCCVIPNPVVVDKYCKSNLNSKQAIAIGRLQYQKGFDILINIFQKVHIKYPEWIVNIYGDGNLKKDLECKIKECGLSGVVNLKGRTTNILQKIQESAFFILPSRFEGFGMVIAEAMTQGVPAISFDCPTGPSDIIRDKVDGLLVENQNQNAMYEAICYMIENQEERKKMGNNAYHNIKRFSGNEIAIKWFSLFEELKVSENRN